MKIIKSKLSGAAQIISDPFIDHRGWFVRFFCQEEMLELNNKVVFEILINIEDAFKYVNTPLILDKEVVKELIQEDFNKQNLKVALTNILETYNREDLFLNYFELEKQLGGKGASKNVASQILAALKST